MWHILDQNYSVSFYELVLDDDNSSDDVCEYFFVKNPIDVHPNSIMMRMQNVDDAVNARDPMMNLKFFNFFFFRYFFHSFFFDFGISTYLADNPF